MAGQGPTLAKVTTSHRTAGKRRLREATGAILVLAVALVAAACVVPPPPPPPPVIAAAGDIACAPYSTHIPNGDLGIGDRCFEKPTSDLLVDGDYDAVVTLGDNQYLYGELANFQTEFERTWGRVKDRIHPSSGNHEYYTANAAGYFGYFGEVAGDPSQGWYSFDLGSWHLIALNSNCDAVGGCGAGSAQEQWLRADLAAHAATKCTLAYWHYPRFSSGSHGNVATMDPFWRALYDYGVDVVLNGHDHNYERFAPQNPDGQADANGIREFVVGTGGYSHYGMGTRKPNSEMFDGSSFGVLELTLYPSSYDWRFRPAAGATFTDSGHGNCH